eukprot:TRINITY_DN2297_c1_g1_i18.p3 TRINITY_DN2297_c1_g1~~TRINITY_DN2297_c1_g1_i18.p3  ORF type:complete len:130 (-),score=14.83 TRINITY_DN2297_c1_g1_i18:618-1007(-)
MLGLDAHQINIVIIGQCRMFTMQLTGKLQPMHGKCHSPYSAPQLTLKATGHSALFHFSPSREESRAAKTLFMFLAESCHGSALKKLNLFVQSVGLLALQVSLRKRAFMIALATPRVTPMRKRSMVLLGA